MNHLQVVEITISSNKKILCGSLYRPPNTNLEEFLDDFENMLHE